MVDKEPDISEIINQATGGTGVWVEIPKPPPAVEQGLAEVPERGGDGRVGSITVSYSAVTEAELELIKDVLERLKPREPAAPKWRTSALQAVSSLGMLAKVLQDYLKPAFDGADFVLLLIGLTGVITIFLNHQDAVRKHEEELKKFREGDVHHRRAIEYATTLLREQRERAKRTSGG